MKSITLPLLLFVVACGGGGASGDEDALANSQGVGAGEGTEPTAAELFADCFQQDATEIARVLGLLEGFFGEDAGEFPMPTLDLLSGLLNGGKIPYTWDLDGDSVNELSGSLRFLDENGATTIPFSLGELSGLDLNDPASLLTAVPAGSRLELSYELGGSFLVAANEGSGAGTLVFGLGEGTIDGIGGTGSFSVGECGVEFELDNIEIDPDLLAGYPAAAIGFTATLGDDSLTGTMSLDGSDAVTVSASLNGAAVETFEFDLPALALPTGE